MKTIGMLVVLDAIFNRVTQNRLEGRNTWIFIDEIYVLFANEYFANFLFEMWKRVRKYGAFCTGITNAEAGKGLLKCAGSIVPFEDRFPRQTKFYGLMTTKPNEQESWRKVE